MTDSKQTEQTPAQKPNPGVPVFDSIDALNAAIRNLFGEAPTETYRASNLTPAGDAEHRKRDGATTRKFVAGTMIGKKAVGGFQRLNADGTLTDPAADPQRNLTVTVRDRKVVDGVVDQTDAGILTGPEHPDRNIIADLLIDGVKVRTVTFRSGTAAAGNVSDADLLSAL